jgi:hypothetical protein
LWRFKRRNTHDNDLHSRRNIFGRQAPAAHHRGILAPPEMGMSADDCAVRKRPLEFRHAFIGDVRAVKDEVFRLGEFLEIA